MSEIKKVARRDPVLGGEGAVVLLERLSPALEQVDSSSGSIGTAVNNAISALAPLIAAAPADAKTRDRWLERLWAAHEADRIPYIETLGDHWGELCGSREVASAWADDLIGITRMARSSDPNLRGHFHGTAGCLSALYRAERHEEILDILKSEGMWHYRRWAVMALAALGRKAEAIQYAESCRGPWTPDGEVDAVCEEMLLSSGLVDEAYTRYGLRANRAGTYLATYRAVAKKYPHKRPADVLADLVTTTPGEEAKWFAAAKDIGLYDEALALAESGPCDPRTLTRAARDLAESQSSFAAAAGLLALEGLAQGYGYDVTSADVSAAYQHTMRAAEYAGRSNEVRD
ncbi:MAG TPA: hypothetical protein VNL71_16240, partial [Chloroflexota bacterium]|nr:hypothetical protein [Chloroflexota bacterium]